MYQSDKQSTRVFKAFCDENRLQILALLRGGEKCACKLLDDLQITRSIQKARTVQGNCCNSSCRWKLPAEKIEVVVIDKEAIAWDG